MNDKKFSFAVLAYKQENVILETLESIKYQILKYGDGRIFNIYIIDDASSDNTAGVAKEWTEKNKKLFNNIKLICNEINKGTVANYNKIMELINDEQFKVIAADDLIGPNSIFDDISCDELVLDTFPFYKLMDGVISLNHRYLKDYYYRYKRYKPSKNLKWMRRGDFIHTPSNFYSKYAYDKGECESFNSQFMLFEDDPSYYCMFRNNNMTVRFHLEPKILYRYTSASTSTIPNKVFMNDWYLLQERYYNDVKGFSKLYYYFRKNRQIKFSINPFKFIDRINYLYRIVYVNLIDRKGFMHFKKEIDGNIKKVQDYYNYISKLNNYRRTEL